ncbi:MAG: MarR family transcriptional regulator [Burkholderiales bacterium]|nr:MarR family transcriptional regulator [Burkholderiales bacterium]
MAKNSSSPPETGGVQPLDQSELKKHPGYFLARARYIAFRTFDQHIGEAHQLRPVEFALLVLLGSNRDATQKQLSRALGVAQPNMTGVLRRLEGRGLLERTRAEMDKRMQFITLTTAGAKLMRQATAAGKGMDQDWLGRLSPAEQAMLVELLEKVSLAANAED